ncbi:hypothetical protein GCM10023350_17680 [Nocardioides endophyticus]|uniref:Sensor domain-containing protein n=1 Tax=Nocardioides endophyticus TaxID=1353775 RepID=A0ABP8YPD0_9ACTN
MRDPLDELENFTDPGLTMSPLPASEVRRRGTRMRRRNNALAAIGGVAVVAIIATPLAMAATGNRTDTTPPVTNPSPSWVTKIPAGFPLAEGLPTPVQTSASYDSPVTDVCAGAGWGPTGSYEVQQATYTESEGGSTHTLALYPTAGEAELALTALSAEMQACVLQTEGKQRWVGVLPSDDGDQSLVYANHYSDGGDVDAVQLVRVGNAILQATTSSLGAPAEDTAALVQERSAPVIDAMCAFAADPC